MSVKTVSFPEKAGGFTPPAPPVGYLWKRKPEEADR